MEFKLTEDQEKQIQEWAGHCDTYAGAIGGRISITFTPTGLGMCVEAKCICGESINVTECDNW